MFLVGSPNGCFKGSVGSNLLKFPHLHCRLLEVQMWLVAFVRRPRRFHGMRWEDWIVVVVVATEVPGGGIIKRFTMTCQVIGTYYIGWFPWLNYQFPSFVWYSINRLFHHDLPGPNSFIMKKLGFHNEYTWYDSLFCRELFHEEWKHPGFSLGQDVIASFDFEHFEIASKKVQLSIGCFCWLHGWPGSAWSRQWVLDVRMKQLQKFLHGVCCKWVASLP